MSNTNEPPITPLSPLAKKYLIVFIIASLFGMALVFLRVAGRRQQLIDQKKAGLLPEQSPFLPSPPEAAESPQP